MDVTKNIPVQYDDEKHLYSLRGQRYTSASQLVEKFKNPFNTRERAEKYAAKHGGTAEYWIKVWEEKKNKSLVRGNHIHDANEVALHGRMIGRFLGKTLPVIAHIQDTDPWYERPDGIYTEKMIWHHGYRIAGRSDKIILETVYDQIGGEDSSLRGVRERIAHVEDYKTNERLDFESFQFKDGTYKRMRPPLGHIMDSNWWHYQLQLSAYMFMLEYQGFKPGNMHVIHYPHPTEEEPNPKPQVYPVSYLKREVVLMCTYLNR